MVKYSIDYTVGCFQVLYGLFFSKIFKKFQENNRGQLFLLTDCRQISLLTLTHFSPVLRFIQKPVASFAEQNK